MFSRSVPMFDFRLPAARPLHRGINVWKMLKDAIGKDLTRISMPATINEPLSGLQRTAEELQYRWVAVRSST